MNLTGYAGQHVQFNVSFAVGNSAGLSEFSPTAFIKINTSTCNFTINTSVHVLPVATIAIAIINQYARNFVLGPVKCIAYALS